MRMVILVLLFLCLHKARGQTGASYPDFFSSSSLYPSLINPAYISPSNRSQAIVLGKFRSGLLRDVYSLAGSFEKLWISKKNTFHSARIIVHNEKEGPYIARPRIYANYSTGILIASETRLMAGASFGLVQSNFNVPSKVFSVTNPDLNIGVFVRHKELEAGISAQQVLQSGSRGAAVVYLNNYYNFYMGWSKSLNPTLKVNSSLICSLLPVIPDLVNGRISLFFHEKFESGVAYTYKDGVSLFSSLLLGPQDHTLRISVLYNSTFLDKNVVWGSSLEFGFSYLY